MKVGVGIMKLLVVDDEPMALKDIVGQLKHLSILQESHITALDDSTEALNFIKENTVDIIFLDINMPGLNGLDLARKIQELQPACHIIFLTGYSAYAVEAFKIKVQGYLLKPVLPEELEREIKYCLESKPQLHIQCFGNFSVFYQGKPVHFSREKAKELLAYLVDRKGTFVAQPELIAILWEDHPDTPAIRSLLRNLVSSLRQTFKELNYENLIVTKRNEIAVNVDLFTCDYYDYLKTSNKPLSSDLLCNYMCNYSWG